MPLCYVMPRVLLCAVKVSALILIMFCHAIGAVMPLCAVKPLVLLCHSVTSDLPEVSSHPFIPLILPHHSNYPSH
jgi:hypothetical protein